MIYIRHRVNKIHDLESVESTNGVEIDLRSDVSLSRSMHLSHDPWVKGDNFKDWLTQYSKLKINGPLILNTKEDGLEEAIINELAIFNIDNFIFLDTAIPTLIRFIKNGHGQKFFWRVSSYETIEQALQFKGQIKWLWVDCFDGIPLKYSKLSFLKKEFKLCLVSPELQKKDLAYDELFNSLKSIADAICTKSPEQWEKLYS